MSIRPVSIAALACALATPAFGAEGPDDYAMVDQIVVTGQRLQYGVEQTRTATKTDTDIKDIPQSLSVVTEAQIEDQALRSIADILTYVPGAMAGTGESNRDQITLRGNNTTADFFVDGIRDDAQYFRDLYNADRIEVLRGPNAMIFGRGGGGGVVNRVTKRASLEPYREFAVSGDSEGGYRLTGDVDQPLGNSVGLRVNGVYENGESFRRHVELERYGINPTVGVEIGADTRIDLSYEYLHDRRTADRGVPAFGSRPLEGFDRVFFGNPDLSFSDADVHLATFAIEHRLGENVTLRNRTQYGHYDKFYQNVFPSDLIEATERVRLGAYNQRSDRDNLFSQTDLVVEGLGGLDHTLLVGFEYGRQKSRNQRKTGSFPGSNEVPLTDPTTDIVPVFASGASDANNRTRANVLAFYIQDQLRLSPMFEIVAGVRFDRFELDVNELRGAGTRFERVDNLLSPRIGLIAKPSDNLSLYASYSRSYLPSSGDQFSALTSETAELKPEKFDNYEVGAKWEPIDGLLATIAFYQLDRTNTRAVDPVTLLTVLTGAQRSRGIEVGVERNITNKWQISAGYAHQKAEITRTTAAAPEGREVPLVPRHQFSLWTRYDFTPALGLGLGVVARTKSYSAISNAVTLPGYARVDAALFYQLAHGIEAQLNVENLFGRDYFATAHSDNNIAPGAPTTARATLRFTF
ncbi:TonB-dependent siderophore receptor [Sphingosinicella sp. LY1275]|uniref:TonB-dependent receptor n=1 Tax=Sphingosinicella sp. LY1275 TaxID=3095379 RepID=UPI002ADEF383|nr:TonB-dependent siderophore receptor [Sphingosinicella sp. LY1275]MEA1015090.1 TonB-dependent siderophore receptor [Sphingosinicella sp. LY1275]